MKPAMFEASPDTRLLRQYLSDTNVGDFISYGELGRIISRTVNGSTKTLQSALNYLLRHEQIVFSTVRGEGVKRLNDGEIVRASDGDMTVLRRRAKKAAVKITAVQDFAALTPAEQLAHTTKLSIFTAFAAMATDRGLKRVEPIAAGRAGELPIAETLRAFLDPPKENA